MMIESENIFDIWKHVGKVLPFIVKRNNWRHMSYLITKIEPRGNYGKAYGFRMNDGIKLENVEEELIECCGCGNWQLIENLNNDLTKAKWRIFDESGILLIGKYKGANIDEVKENYPDYFNWMLLHIGGFNITYYSWKNNIKLSNIQKIKDELKSNLSFNSDEWFKSSKYEFESTLIQCVLRIANNEYTMEKAIEEMNRLYIEK